MKKWVAVFLVLTMMFSCISALADVTDNDVNPAGVYPIAKNAGLTLTIGVTSSDYVTDYDENYLTRRLEEISGTDIEAVVFPSTDAETKLTLMATGAQELPDILTFGVTGATMRNTLADAGCLTPLDDYFADEELSAPFRKRCEEIGMDPEYLLNQIRSLDGHIYAVPHYEYKPTNIYFNRAYVNKDWLDALGLSVPTNIDELTQMLIAFRDQDPNGNGIKDEIPMSGMYGYTNNNCMLNWLMQLFIYNDCESTRYLPLSQTEGKIDVAYDKDAYREFLKYANMLLSEGLLDEAVMTQNLTDLRSQLQADEQTIGMISGSANGFGDNIGSWIPIEQPMGYNGLRQVTAWIGGMNISAKWVITTSCEHPELAFRLAMACYEDDELMLCARYGEKDVDWRYAKEGEQSIYGDAIKPNLFVMNAVWATISNQLWQLEFIPYLCAKNSFVEVFDGNELYGEYYHGQSVMMNMKYGPDINDVVNTILYTEEEMDRWNEVRTAINSYVEEQLALFCVGQLDPNSDEDWNNYLAGLNKMKYQEMLAMDTAAYNRTYSLH